MQRFFYPLIEPLNMHRKFHILLVWDYFQNCFFFILTLILAMRGKILPCHDNRQKPLT